MSGYDLVLWGATGFTGRLVAGYLAEHAPDGLRWAIGGRDREKLESVRSSLGGDVDTLVGDSLDRESLEAVVPRTRVVVSTVGPYFRYGTPLVEACVEHGVDYCDLTGEPHWIRGNVDRLHDAALESGARIVHCCGFDSIPSDCGVLALHEHLRSEHGRRLAAARLVVTRIKGGISGGTAASMLLAMEQAGRDRAVRRTLVDPYALNPPGEREGPDGWDQRSARYDEELGRWTSPFVMASINTRIVRRSNALMGYPYGRDFRYSEAAAARNRRSARLAAAGLKAVMIGGALAPSRWLLRKLAPSPGEGPSRERREAGSFEMKIFGRSDGDEPVEAIAVVRGESDPGYGETSKMLAESGLCLALDELPRRGGILTPASCMGMTLVERLRAAGMTFRVEDRPA